MSKKVIGVVLCGGQSSRMGQQKSLLQHNSGGSYLQHAIKRLKDICDEVCIAGMPDPETEIPDPSTSQADQTIADSVPHQGPVVGIVSGLEFAKASRLPACFVTPVDMPNLTTEDLRKLLYAWRSKPQLTIAANEKDNSPQPLVGIYPTALLTQVRKLSQSEDRSLHRWIKQQPHQSVSLSEHACHNVNSPEDLG